MSTPHERRVGPIGRLPRAAVAMLIGGILATAVCVATFYDRPARSAVHRILVNLGLRSSRGQLYGFNANDFRSAGMLATWTGVRAPTSPDWRIRPGLDVEADARGFEYPVNLAFVEQPGDEPDAPLYYVAELHGTIKYVTRAGAVETFATGLTNFEPEESYVTLVESDEKGLSGLAIVPGTHDLIVTGTYLDEERGLLVNRVVRVFGEDGGRRAARVEPILAPAEVSTPSHQIQQVAPTPDGHLMVAVGDAMRFQHALDRSTFRGKILRLDYDGSALADNPFYDAATPEAPASYIYAYGVRNVFDIDFDPRNGRAYATDVGDRVDRVIELHPGVSYGWDGSTESMRVNALFSWGELTATAPVGLTFLDEPTLGPGTAGRMYVATFGASEPDAPRGYGRAIFELVLDPETGLLAVTPTPILQYVGAGRSTVLGLAEGPDGLYFTDFFGPDHVAGSHGTGIVYRVFPSAESAALADGGADLLDGLGPVEAGRVLISRNCLGCHRIDGVGGFDGPDLSHAATTVGRRVNSRAYEAEVRRLLAAGDGGAAGASAEDRDRLLDVTRTPHEGRVEVWLRHHIAEPRFDNPYARMPAFDQLSERETQAIIAALMTLE